MFHPVLCHEKPFMCFYLLPLFTFDQKATLQCDSASLFPSNTSVHMSMWNKGSPEPEIHCAQVCCTRPVPLSSQWDFYLLKRNECNLKQSNEGRHFLAECLTPKVQMHWVEEKEGGGGFASALAVSVTLWTPHVVQHKVRFHAFLRRHVEICWSQRHLCKLYVSN